MLIFEDNFVNQMDKKPKAKTIEVSDLYAKPSEDNEEEKVAGPYGNGQNHFDLDFYNKGNVSI